MAKADDPCIVNGQRILNVSSYRSDIQSLIKLVPYWQQIGMLKNYILIAWRSLVKRKALSGINIGGLAVGIAGSVLLLCYISLQYSYDSFHTRGQDIYRVNLDVLQDGQVTIHSAENYSAVGPALKKDFPEIQDQARLYNMGYKNNCVFTYNDTYFRETRFLYADSSFLTMFSFPFLEGDPRSALTQPYTAVISESAAKKFFGQRGREIAVGRSIWMNDDDRHKELCKITGVFKDIPENSHLQFNILISYTTLFHRGGGAARYELNWDRKDYYTYVLLRPGTDPAVLQAKLSGFVNRHIPGENTLRQQSRLSLQPLSKAHFNTGRIDEPSPTINSKALGFLMIIAFFIITIAWVNYINLATAGSADRAKEIGIRKVMGSLRSQLIRQFLVESLGLNVISCLLALLIIYLLRPLLHSFFSIDLPLSVLFGNAYGLIFLAFLVAGTFFSGLYPALVLSSFRPISVLKGKIDSLRQGILLRRALVVFQFGLSILLIIGTIVVYRQVHYMLNQDIGIRTDQVMVLDRPGKWDSARTTHNLLVQRFKESLRNDPAVTAVGMSDEMPGKEIRWPSDYARNDIPAEHAVPINSTMIDQDYLPALGFNILAGRNFSTDRKTDSNGVILTVSATRLLGFTRVEEAVGKELRSGNDRFRITGVVNDFHQLSLEKEMTPAVFWFNGKDMREFEYYMIRLKTTDLHNAVSRIRTAWTDNFKDNPFDFTFLEDSFNRQYKSEIQFGIVFGIFSLLAICIACIGLFALVAFMIRQRTREIGIRKVLGAGIPDILLLLTKDFIRLLLIANAIAWPLGWLLMSSWLKDFAYRIHVEWWFFAGAGIITLLIALATISFQAITAATANPVKNLRSE